MSAGDQIELLANFIMSHVDGEPSRSEGAGETAIRIITAQRHELSREREVRRALAEAIEHLNGIHPTEQENRGRAWATVECALAASRKMDGSTPRCEHGLPTMPAPEHSHCPKIDSVERRLMDDPERIKEGGE